MVLVSVLVAVGQGNDGEGVDRFHQRTLCKCFCYHLTAVVWHCIPDGKKGQILVTQIQGCVISYHLNLVRKSDASNNTADSKFMPSLCKSRHSNTFLNLCKDKLNNLDTEAIDTTLQTPGSLCDSVAGEAIY